MSLRLGAIDIGSNAMRLLISEVDSDGNLSLLKKQREPVRLGLDAFLHHKISEDHIQLALQGLLKFKKHLKNFEVKKLRVVATSAARESENGWEFTQRVKKETGFLLEIIDSEEEGHLIANAVCKALPEISKGSTLHFDIGGGSVEFNLFQNGQYHSTLSLPMGTLRIQANKDFQSDNYKQLDQFIHQFQKPIEKFIKEHGGEFQLQYCVGTGGNLECLGQLRLQLLKKKPTHIKEKDLDVIMLELENLGYKGRIRELGLRADRSDVILPASFLVKMIFELFTVDRILIPGVGLKEGLILSLVHQTG